MLLLGAKNVGTNKLLSAPPQNITNPAKEAIPGDRVSLEVSWQVNGQETRRTAEELVFNQETKSAMSQSAWVYNGSVVWDGRFLAQREGALVSLVTDPVALINNAGAGHDNDHIWAVNTNALPPVDTPLQVIITLPDASPGR